MLLQALSVVKSANKRMFVQMCAGDMHDFELRHLNNLARTVLTARFDCKMRTTSAIAAFVDGFAAASKAEQQCGDKTRVEFANSEIDDGFVSFFSQGEGAFQRVHHVNAQLFTFNYLHRRVAPSCL